jgi:hypothetical protein
LDHLIPDSGPVLNQIQPEAVSLLDDTGSHLSSRGLELRLMKARRCSFGKSPVIETLSLRVATHSESLHYGPMLGAAP